MEQKDTPENQGAYFADEMAQLAAKLRALAPEAGPYYQLAKQVSAEILEQAGATSYDPARQILEAHRRGSLHFDQTLNETLGLLQSLETARQQREKYSPLWWEQTNATLESAFATDPEGATLLWMATYVEALLDWVLPSCQRLVNGSFAFPRALLPYVLQIRMGDQAMQSGDYSSALPMLENLLERVSTLLEVNHRVQAALLAVFIGRIYQDQQDNKEKAANLFQQAADLASHDGRPLAAQAILALKGDESGWGQANQLLSQALELSPDKPEPFVGKAMLAEARSLWREADDWYRKAIQSTLDKPNWLTVLSKLLAPGSGRLYLAAARQLVQTGDLDSALQAVRKSQQLLFKDGTDYPMRGAQALEADIRLAQAGEQPPVEEKADIAKLYFEAGKHYYWSAELPTAIELFRKELDLISDHAKTYFYIADGLRVVNHKPTPPYYDRAALAWESLDAWEKGMQLSGDLTKNEAWVYLARADISIQLDRLPDQDKSAHRWQGLLACEQALLINASKGNAWNMLSAELNHQELFENAKIAIRKALDLDENNLENLIEHLSILINTGDFNEAEQVYSQVVDHPDITEDRRTHFMSWLALNEYYQGKFEEALDHLEPAWKENSDDLWLRDVRRNIYIKQGDLENARQEAEWIWERRDNQDYKPDTSEFASAAFHLGYFSETINRMDSQLEPAADRRIAHVLTGLAYLGLGKLEQAGEYLQKSLELAGDSLQAIIDIVYDLESLEKRAQREGWPHADQLVEWINRPGGLKDQAQVKRQTLKSDAGSPWREYEKLLNDPNMGQLGSPSWLGAQAGLGRLNLDAGKLPAARDTYLSLLPYADHFRELHRGLRWTGAAWLKRTRDQAQHQKYSQAALSLQALRDEPRLLPEPSDQAELESLQFLVDLSQRQIEVVEDSLLRALHAYQEIYPQAAGTQLANNMRANLPDLQMLWKVDDFLHNLPIDLQDNDSITQVREGLGTHVEEYLAVNRASSKVKYPVVTPIAVEIGDFLVPTVPDDEWPVIQSYLPAMRERVRNTMGVKLTGVRFRGTTWGPDYGHYFRVLVEESVVATATISPERWFLFAPRGFPPMILRMFDLFVKQGKLEAADPLVPGYWIDPELGPQLQREYGDELQRNGSIEIWQNPAQYMIYYLEAVLHRRLSLFLGYQEMVDLLEPLMKEKEGDRMMEKVLPDRPTYVRLWRLLRRLLDDEVSIKPLKEILLALLERGLIHDDVHTDLIEVRQQIKAYLPGNLPGDRTLAVDPALEEILSLSLQNQDAKRFLAIPGNSEFISKFKAWKAQNDPDAQAVLVVSDDELRPFFQKMIRRIPSEHLVIAQTELLSTGSLAEANPDPRML